MVYSSRLVDVSRLYPIWWWGNQALAVKASPRQRILESIVKWLAIAMTGVATGVVASGIDYGIVRLTELRFGLMRLLIEKGSNVAVLLVLQVALCTTLASIAALLVCFVSPLAAGSGIPEVKCRLNGLDLPLVVKPRTLLAKACGVLFSVSAGLPCGKEGPMIHSGSILGSLCARMVFAQFPESALLRDLDERDFIAAGGAAGIGCVKLSDALTVNHLYACRCCESQRQSPGTNILTY